MNAMVIEHVKVNDLPQDWCERLHAKSDARVTVRIEEEVEQSAANQIQSFVTNDPAFGIWRGRDDMTDVDAYLHKLRAPRFSREQEP